MEAHPDYKQKKLTEWTEVILGFAESLPTFATLALPKKCSFATLAPNIKCFCGGIELPLREEVMQQ